MGRGGDAERLKSLTREETFVSEAISDDCGAKLLQKNDLKKVKCTKSEKNAIKYEKNRSSCISTIISYWRICQLFTKFTKFTHFRVRYGAARSSSSASRVPEAAAFH